MVTLRLEVVSVFYTGNRYRKPFRVRPIWRRRNYFPLKAFLFCTTVLKPDLKKEIMPASSVQWVSYLWRVACDSFTLKALVMVVELKSTHRREIE